MMYSVAVTSARGLAWTMVSALALLACSFDSSPVAPANERRPLESIGGSDAGGRDAASEPTDHPPPAIDSGVTTPPDRIDAGGSDPVDPPEMNPDPVMDAGGTDEMDAAADAAPDATPPDEEDDASVDEPDTGPGCTDDPPCVCPHEAEISTDPCAPALCAIDQCAPDDDCRYLTRGSHRYYFCDDERTWAQARTRCSELEDFRLVSVDTAEEDAFILANVQDKTWLGGSDTQQEGRWRWTDGTSFYDDEDGALNGRYVNWHGTEPNNAGLGGSAPDCLLLWYENEVWADGSCGDLNGYVCELDP